MISFRPIEMPEDAPLLMRVYRSTREDELKQTGWTEVEKVAFLRMQFQAQHTHYQSHYPHCEYLVVLENGIPVGRLYIDTAPGMLHILDIALLCEHRNRGMGSRLMGEILAEAERLGRKVAIFVEENNPAMHLYERLGFKKVEHRGIYHHMHWIAPSEASEATPKIWAQARIDD